MYDRVHKSKSSKFIFAENEARESGYYFCTRQWLFTDGRESGTACMRKNMRPFVLPSGKYSISTGRFGGVLTGQERYSGRVSDGMGIFKGCTDEEWCAGRMLVLKEDQATFTWENAKVFQKSYGSEQVLNIRKAIIMLQKLSC